MVGIADDPPIENEPSNGGGAAGQGAADGTTRTFIDSFLELLRSKGRITLTDASLALGVDVEIIERWSKALEAVGMIKVTYSMDKMYLEPATLSPEGGAMVRTRLETRKSIIKGNIAAEKAVTEQFSEEIAKLNTSVIKLEEGYYKNIPEVQKMLRELDRVYKAIGDAGSQLDAIRKRADDSGAEIESRVELLHRRIEQFNKMNEAEEVAKTQKTVQDALRNAEIAETAIREMRFEVANTFEAMRQSIAAQARAALKRVDSKEQEARSEIETRGAKLTEFSIELRKRVSESKELIGQIREFEDDQARMLKGMDRVKAEFADGYAMIKSRVEVARQVIETDQDAMGGRIRQIKSASEEVSEIDKQLDELKGDVLNLKKQLTDIKNELDTLSKAFRLLDSMSNAAIESRLEVLEDVTDKEKRVRESVNKMKKRISEVAGKMRARPDDDAKAAGKGSGKKAAGPDRKETKK